MELTADDFAIIAGGIALAALFAITTLLPTKDDEE